MDVHPPGAKMLIAGLAWVLGLPKNFDFNIIGLDYLEADVPYVGMRLLPAILGTLLVPIMFWTCLGLGLEMEYSILGALLVLFENALTVQFRFIFLDAYLVFSSAVAICCYVYFQKERRNPFSLWWWVLLMAMGIFLGLASSCKWVGLFTVATIGIATLIDLWQLFTSPRVVSLGSFFLHFMARFFALILLPTAIYVGCFWINFKLLTKMGPGGSSMSLPFQQSLNGDHILPPTNSPVGYGSIVTIRHLIQKSFLHSHPHLYPDGSQQQQVTLYPFFDANNEWIILPRHPDPFRKNDAWSTWPGNPGASHNSDSSFVPLRDGDRIRVVHHLTRRNLHSHRVSPPLSNKDHHWEVSCYGLVGDVNSFGDTNDDWIVRITDRWGNELQDQDEVFNGFSSKYRHMEDPIASQSTFNLPVYYMDDFTENHADEMEQEQSPPHLQESLPGNGSLYIELDDTLPNDQVMASSEQESMSPDPVFIDDDASNESQASSHSNTPINNDHTDSLNTSDATPLESLPLRVPHLGIRNEGNATPANERILVFDADKDLFSPITQPIMARRTFFKLVHANTGCVLSSFGKNLPDWGFHQLEVTCGRDTLRSHDVLVIETNTNPLSMFIIIDYSVSHRSKKCHIPKTWVLGVFHGIAFPNVELEQKSNGSALL